MPAAPLPATRIKDAANRPTLTDEHRLVTDHATFGVGSTRVGDFLALVGASVLPPAQDAAAAAAASAAAASASATASSTSATSAAASASAAAGDAASANTYAGQALTRANNAAASATAANTAYANALSQAGVALSHANNAGSLAASASTSATAAATSATAAAGAAAIANDYKNEAMTSAAIAGGAADAAAASATSAGESAGTAAGNATAAGTSATAAAASASAASTSAANAATSATTATTQAAAASASATAALNAIAQQFKGGIAGNAVPNTSTATGDTYRITSAGSSQSKTWSVGDAAIYNGTSGSWTQLTGFYAGAASYTDERVAGTLAAASLSFDGTAGAELSPPIPAIGTGDFTVAFFGRSPALGNAGAVFGALGGPQVYVSGNGKLGLGANGGVVEVDVDSPGEWAAYAVTRGGGYLRFYQNGAQLGAAVATADDYTGDIGLLGIFGALNGQRIGGLARVAFLNCAMTADDVARLHRVLGVLPAELQRPARRTVASWSSSAEAFDSSDSMGFSLTKTGAWGTFIQPVGVGSPPVGRPYRVTFNAALSGGGAWTVANDGYAISAPVAAGANTFYVASYTGGVPFFITSTDAGASLTVTDFRFEASGALYLQPDSNAGAGPVLSGPYGLPDTVLPGDGHETGGVVRTMPGERGVITATRGSSGYLIGDHRIVPEGYGVDLVGSECASGDTHVNVGISAGNPYFYVADANPGTAGSAYLPAGSISTTGKVYAELTDASDTTVHLHISRR